ncbi:hypothetical protein EV122DRAFT_254419 [Schizophyllum commune]
MALTTVKRVEYMSYPHELAEAFELYTFARDLNALAYTNANSKFSKTLSTTLRSKNPARDPKARKEENTKQARAMHVHSAEDHTRQCTLADFWHKYVEGRGYVCLSKANLDSVIAQLDANGHFIDSEWKLLQPDKKLRTENEHFGRLCEVIDAVVDAAATCLGDRFSSENRITLFDSRPNQETLSEVPGSSFHVDGLHYLIKSTYAFDSYPGSAHNNTLSIKSGCKINTADVVGSVEVKLDENPVTVRDVCASVNSSHVELTFTRQDDAKTIGAAGC